MATLCTPLLAVVSETQLLIIVGFCLALVMAVACLVYAFASSWTNPDVIERVEALERQQKAMRDGMKRAGTWKSEYDIRSPDLRVRGGSA